MVQGNATLSEPSSTTPSPQKKRVRTIPPPPPKGAAAWGLTSYGLVMEIQAHPTFDNAALQASVQHYDEVAARSDTPFSVLLDLRALAAAADAQQALVASYFTALASSDPERAQGTAFLTATGQAYDAMAWLLELDPPHSICTFGSEVPAARWCLSRVLDPSQMPSEEDFEGARLGSIGAAP